MRTSILLLFVAGSTFVKAQQIRFVKHDASGANNGTTWNDAFNSLQSALTASGNGDSIFIAKGTYYPSAVADGVSSDPRDKAFVLKEGVSIFGGFSGSESGFSDRNHDSLAVHLTNRTILSGDLGTANDSSDNAYHVLIASNINAAVVEGLTIADGNANGSGSITVNTKAHFRDFGGAIHAHAATFHLNNSLVRNNLALTGGGGLRSLSATPEIRHVHFIQNKVWGINPALSGGGGVLINGGSPEFIHSGFEKNEIHDAQGGGGMRIESTTGSVMKHCHFSGNEAHNGDGGAGLYMFNSNGTLDSVDFINNYTTNQGGGFYGDNALPFLSDCNFISNISDNGGGAMEIDGNSHLNLFNCYFSSNFTDGNGGAIQNWTSSPFIIDCLFESNTALGDGGAIYNYNTCSPEITNCIFALNQCDGNGGAIYNRRNCHPAITNVVMYDNHADLDGGGIYTVESNGQPCSPVVTNTTIFGNFAGGTGGGAFDDGAGNPKLRNSIVTGNISPTGSPDVEAPPTIAATALFRAIIGTDFFLNGITTPTPFAGPLFVDQVNGDFRLTANSFALHRGDSTFFNVGQSPDISHITGDLRGADRITGTNIDLGAYEVCLDTGRLSITISTAKTTVHYLDIVTFQATLTAGGNNPTFIWYINGSPISKTGSTIILEAGTEFENGDVISASVKSSNPCDDAIEAFSQNLTMLVWPVGIQEAGAFNFKIYPNPNNGQFNVLSRISNASSLEMILYDARGREMARENYIQEAGSFEKSIVLSLQKGMYVLKLTSDNGESYTQRFIVE